MTMMTVRSVTSGARPHGAGMASATKSEIMNVAISMMAIVRRTVQA
jgi:hypothetical protein